VCSYCKPATCSYLMVLPFKRENRHFLHLDDHQLEQRPTYHFRCASGPFVDQEYQINLCTTAGNHSFRYQVTLCTCPAGPRYKQDLPPILTSPPVSTFLPTLEWIKLRPYTSSPDGYSCIPHQSLSHITCQYYHGVPVLGTGTTVRWLPVADPPQPPACPAITL